VCHGQEITEAKRLACGDQRPARLPFGMVEVLAVGEQRSSYRMHNSSVS
jgi:hypothetical protein